MHYFQKLANAKQYDFLLHHRTERTEDNVGDRTVHGLAHDDAQNDTVGTNQRADDDQQCVVDDKTRGTGDDTGVAV